jgi:HAD superfamily hydrolase (TIGR01509 family)
MTTGPARPRDGVGAVLLDFDGPVCRLFAGYPAPRIAAELVDVLRRRGTRPPPDLVGEQDPLAVLRRTAATGDEDATRAVEDALCAAERRAVETAEPTPYAREVIVAARRAGLAVAVVSNNSAGAVDAYLAAHRLAGHVSSVVGRAYATPDRMKPDPAPIRAAVRAVGESPGRCVLVGDSLADLDGARAAGVRAIGYANHPDKVEAFRAAGADAVVASMWDVAAVLLG